MAPAGHGAAGRGIISLSSTRTYAMQCKQPGAISARPTIMPAGGGSACCRASQHTLLRLQKEEAHGSASPCPSPGPPCMHAGRKVLPLQLYTFTSGPHA